ncbi:MAG: hypothetical protein EBX52_05070 [Proteobacteria bacterium]|nr:hypothetical protein [Pseudomonadota bacterium]
MNKAIKQEAQLSLFETPEPENPVAIKEVKKPTMIDLLRYRFENGEIQPEDYKKWIRFLVQNSFKSIE